MELDEDTLNAFWTKDNNGKPQFFIINEAIMSKLCILGEDVEPCFEGASITPVQFSFEDDYKNKLLSMDNSLIKKTSDYISNMNIIIFYPDDLELLKGSPQNRRKYLNLELSQLYSNYYIVSNDYNKLLKMRNEYLKKMNFNNNIDLNYFDILTNYLIDKAIVLIKMRNKYIEKINAYCETIYKDIMNKLEK